MCRLRGKSTGVISFRSAITATETVTTLYRRKIAKTRGVEFEVNYGVGCMELSYSSRARDNLP